MQEVLRLGTGYGTQAPVSSACCLMSSRLLSTWVGLFLLVLVLKRVEFRIFWDSLFGFQGNEDGRKKKFPGRIRISSTASSLFCPQTINI